MRQSLRKSVQCRSQASRLWVSSFGSMASEPAIQDEPCTRKRNWWSRHETLVLIAAKRKQDLQLQKAGIDNKLKSLEKWEEIETICHEEGIERTAQQCRVRWYRIMPVYLKIKELEKRVTSNTSSFWLMKPSERKAEGFQLVLDREVFDALDEYSKQLLCCTTASSDPSKERRVKEEKYMYEKQSGVSGAEIEGCAQDSSIGLHKRTSETSMGTETKQEDACLHHQSTYWVLSPTQGKQESLGDDLKYEEKNLDDKGQTAIAKIIDERVEENTQHMAGISLACQESIKEDDMQQEGFHTHSVLEDQMEQTFVGVERTLLEDKTSAYSMAKEKDSDRDETRISVNDRYQVTDVHIEETCDEKNQKVDIDLHQYSHGSPSVTLEEEICTITQGLDMPGTIPNTEEMEEQRSMNLFHATEQKVENTIRTDVEQSGHQDCNESSLNHISNEVCQEKNWFDIQYPNGAGIHPTTSVDSQGPVNDLRTDKVVHMNDPIEEHVISVDVRESSHRMTIDNGKYEHECLGTGSVSVSGEVPVVTEGRNAILLDVNKSILKGTEKSEESCNERKENDQKLGPRQDTGSSLHEKGETACTEQDSKAAAEFGNDTPVLPIEGSEKGQVSHDNKFDDDVFTGIQSAISNMTNNALQSIRRLFGR